MKATSAEPSSISRPGSSPVWTSSSASATRPAKAPGAALAVAVGAAIGVRGGVEIGAADLFARLPVAAAPAGPRCRRRRCRARSRRCAARRPAVAPQRFGERIVAVGLVARRDRADRRVDQRDLGREHVAEQAGDAPGDVDARPAECGRRQHLDAGDAAGGRHPIAGGSPSAPGPARSPRRRSAGWRCPTGRSPARAASRHGPAA